MKLNKLFYLLLVLLVSSLSLSAQEVKGQDVISQASKKNNKILKNGFSLKFNFGFPTSDYLAASYDGEDLGGSVELNTTLGIQFGNQWYVYRGGNFGIAINANWLDVSYSTSKDTDPTLYVVDLALVEIGPLVSYAINNDMGFDAFYNLRPNNIWVGSEDVEDVETAFGMSHSVGVGFRYKVLYLGVESNFGKLTLQNFDIDDVQLSTNQTKLTLGFKF
ncbi:hypothetical protein EI427_04160 [Flammeovirga pectinis]|uniref:Outer membrane protein beta-barrel domain-containing protein n=1 Tax=Flammeovirga pectinis TaxID=2494373 RepID=A0A3S9NZU3_9BACT|nr:hypothetical protein [Flammeovirga pectinis]AZQ61446.1 hypothetical protein EI427_04160 [Flammeovirga pectinis]